MKQKKNKDYTEKAEISTDTDERIRAAGRNSCFDR
jgi:hypothetical protein